MTWTQQTSPTTSPITAIAWSGSRFVGLAGSQIIYSTDGIEVPLELSAATEHSNNAATALYLEPSGRFRTHQPGPFDGTNFRVSFLFGYKVAP